MTMKTIQFAAALLAGAAAVLILLITSFEIAMYADFDYYEREYEKYDVLSDLDMEMDDVMYVTEEMMAYLRGERAELSVQTFVEGEEQDFFNEQDRFHMEEVQGLFLGGLTLRRGAMVVFVLSAAVLSMTKGKRIRILCRGYRIVLLLMAVILTGLGIWVFLDFNQVFTVFHKIFFDNDLWIFDPATDYMIRMLPEGLFYDFVIRIGSFFVGGLLILLLLSVGVPYLMKRTEHSGAKNTKKGKI